MAGEKLRATVTQDGVQFSVKVHPGAGKDAVVGIHGGMLKLAVTAAPEKGKANKAVIELLSSALGIRKGSLEILSGASARTKRVLARGMSEEELAERLGIELEG